VSDDATPRVAVVGLGRAGSALIRSLMRARVPVVAAVSRRGEGAPATALFHAKTFTHVRELDLVEIDIALLAIPDDALSDVAGELSQLARPPRIVAHLSGARGPSALAALGARAAAFHPLAALSPDEPVPAGALVAVDACTDDARALLLVLARALLLTPVVVDESVRALYHAGAAITANLSVALVQTAMELLVRAGVDDDTARRGLTTLLASTVQNLVRAPSLRAALTGAVARGDVGTIRSHLEALAFDADTEALYRALSLKLVPLSTATEEKRDEMREVLRGDDAEG
jgi:predicted short-subunit dehydrogenase-like oxidoreductase (DUF2520 family)